jgi:hypothetical protein
MKRGGVCPVCEIPHSFPDGHGPIEPLVAPATTVLGRFWQSGRMGVALAAACFLVATVVPLVTVQHAGGLSPRVGATPLQMVLGDGVYGPYLKSTILFTLPAAGLALMSFLMSRRTRAVMLASRPLVLVVALIPALAGALPILKLAKRHVHVLRYSLGPAAVLIALGVFAGVVGALQFGNGVPEPAARGRDDDDDDD